MVSLRFSALLLLLAVGGALANRNAEPYAKEGYGYGSTPPPYGGPSYSSYPHPPVVHPGGCTCNCNVTVVGDESDNDCPTIVCPTEQIECNGICVDPSQKENCGSCEPCKANEICVTTTRNGQRLFDVGIAAVKRGGAKSSAKAKKSSARGRHNRVFKRADGNEYVCEACVNNGASCAESLCCDGLVCDETTDLCKPAPPSCISEVDASCADIPCCLGLYCDGSDKCNCLSKNDFCDTPEKANACCEGFVCEEPGMGMGKAKCIDPKEKKM